MYYLATLHTTESHENKIHITLYLLTSVTAYTSVSCVRPLYITYIRGDKAILYLFEKLLLGPDQLNFPWIYSKIRP